jgi:ATP-dependent exoDNAse (exonuclease V) beta subunit
MGLAVHAVLQWLDLEGLGNLEQLAAWAAREHGVRTGDVARLARRAAASDSVRQIVAGGRYWREVPICVEVNGALLEGLIDLLYERDDGSLGVLDYKTDQLRTGTAEEHADHYRLQGGAYALAVERATGREVGVVEFLFPTTDPATVVRYERERVVTLVEEVAALAVRSEAVALRADS